MTSGSSHRRPLPTARQLMISTSSSGRWRPGARDLIKRLDPAPVVLLLLPWALLLLEPNWIYSRLIRDSWIYFGYYLNLTDHLRWFDGLYYGSRLSTILPGYLAYRWLPPLAANLCLHMALYYICVHSLYFTVKATLGRFEGCLAALAMGTNPYFLDAVGRDYVDGFGMAYYLAAMLLLTLAARSSHRGVLLFAAGIAAAALVIANLFYALFLPLLLGYQAFLSREYRLADRLRGVFLGALGGASLLLAFCLFNFVVTGRFWFLGPSLDFLRTGGKHRGINPFKDYGAAWLLEAGHLIIPLAILLCWAAAAGRWKQRASQNALACLVFGCQYLAISGLYLAFDQFFHGVALQKYYYASNLLPPAYLALAAVYSMAATGLDHRRLRILTTATGVIFLVSYALAPLASAFLERVSLPVIAFAIAPILLALLVIWLGKPGLTTALGLSLALGLCTCLSRITSQHETELPARGREAAAARHRDYNRDRKGVFLAINQSMKILLAHEPRGDFSFWYDQDEYHGLLFDKIASTYAAQQTFNAVFPSVAISATLPGTERAIFSSSPRAFERARDSLRAIGLDARETSVHRVTAHSLDFTITFIKIVLPGTD